MLAEIVIKENQTLLLNLRSADKGNVRYSKNTMTPEQIAEWDETPETDEDFRERMGMSEPEQA